ncbi:MAG: hypothetical protein J0H61_09010 [Alphaproteobacteria bacterium]|nr:hypothetical protein [Alphaproteobacteria bacterium]
MVQWPAVIAGAITAAGVSFTLHAFAAGIGLAVLSTAPTWRDSSGGLWLLSGIYLLFTALAAFAVGGYVAGRMRAALRLDTTETEFRDGVHGLVTWALAVVLTAVMALGVAATAMPAAVGGGAGSTQSVAGENIIASELDALFRTDRNVPDMTYRRAEAARILLKASGRDGVTDADRDYLATIVAAVADIPPDMAAERANRQIAAAREEIHRARVAGVLQAFFIAAALFVGAAVSWFAACEGGRDRELGLFPAWGRRRAR